ncbi:MAG: DUF996 domain-containing protein [Candidatus Bathyarchaeota archaeon]|nr:MAG: DUF996 domain-containing protein [Candidatus Bathyarchaeota archaeon]
MDFQTSKNLGGIGALLMFLGPLLTFVNAFGGLLSLIGFILVLISLHSFAGIYGESGIFNNALYGFITGVVGGVISVGVFVITALSLLSDLGVTDWTNVTEWTDLFATEAAAFGFIMDLITAVITALIVLFVFAIITAWLYRRSLSMLSSKSGVGMFGTAGLLLLIGAVLIIAIGIGLILVWISILLVAIAFFSMKPMEAASTPQPT